MIRKKSIREVDITRLQEPSLDENDEALLKHGILLFNKGRFWEAHEAWEELWKRREEESRIFFQGIIQAAAGFHRILEKPLLNGAVRNLDKAMLKLRLFPAEFLGIDVEGLRTAIAVAQRVLTTGGMPDEQGVLEKLRPRIRRGKGY